MGKITAKGYTDVMKKDDSSLLEEIRRVKKLLDICNQNFNFTSDTDLLDAFIYEREALNSRYRYLLKLAKQNLK